MRTVLSLAVVFGLVTGLPAQDPPKTAPAVPTADLPTITGAVPHVVLAKAATKDGKVTVTVKVAEQICLPETKNVAMDVVKKVDGKDVTERVTKSVTVMACKTYWKEVQYPLWQPGVSVTDAMGKAISPDDVLKRLEKETAILRTVGGPAAPFYLQTTRSDTLILVTPLPQALPVVPAPLMPPQPGTKPLPVPPEKVPLPAPPAKPKAEFEPNATEQEIIDLTNAERRKANLSALTASPQLVKVARLHSENMAKQDKLDHTLDEKTADQRVTDAGYRWARSGENIAKGQRTPAEAVTSWMNSQGHRDNILTQEYTEIGVAVVEAKDGQKYWTMVLARPR